MGTLHWVPIMPKDASHSDRSLNLFSWHTEVWKGVGKEGGGGGGGKVVNIPRCGKGVNNLLRLQSL